MWSSKSANRRTFLHKEDLTISDQQGTTIFGKSEIPSFISKWCLPHVQTTAWFAMHILSLSGLWVRRWYRGYLAWKEPYSGFLARSSRYLRGRGTDRPAIYRRNLKSSGHETKQAAREQVCVRALRSRGILIMHSSDDGLRDLIPLSATLRFSRHSHRSRGQDNRSSRMFFKLSPQCTVNRRVAVDDVSTWRFLSPARARWDERRWYFLNKISPANGESRATACPWSLRGF